MKKKYIIITGVAGMIGSELLDQIIHKKNYSSNLRNPVKMYVKID